MELSVIIPLYNRPLELEELLASFCRQQKHSLSYEIIVVEDGSQTGSGCVVKSFEDKLPLRYYQKENQGPALARNYGAERAGGRYFLFLDSDTFLPDAFLSNLQSVIEQPDAPDAFGGADMSHDSFSPLQKAITFAMTSLLTTGGVRGKKTGRAAGDKQLRSYNMAVSKQAWGRAGGFSPQRIGEDIDMNFRLKENGFKTQWIDSLSVYHKRRTSLTQFYKQVNNFGAARPILSRMHKGTGRPAYYFPTAFVFFTLASIASALVSPWFLLPLAAYLLLIFISSSLGYKSFFVGLLSVFAALVQFFAYGLGFLRTFLKLNIFRQSEKDAFPLMFKQ